MHFKALVLVSFLFWWKHVYQSLERRVPLCRHSCDPLHGIQESFSQERKHASHQNDICLIGFICFMGETYAWSWASFTDNKDVMVSFLLLSVYVGQGERLSYALNYPSNIMLLMSCLNIIVKTEDGPTLFLLAAKRTWKNYNFGNRSSVSLLVSFCIPFFILLLFLFHKYCI